ncbi:monooxygenase [Zafaria cholistanensis]|uniref:Monooxygenase n=1 Tax=Zafaria cholistanensis TaxID=1682741 RepID=A0A5A7NSV0_9MICC|nr:acyl-CoA dehydrogenase family protein [Zafaria cholistanensis]GER23676.1 monooxygenase [Zafaria cholistanensis]
MATVVNDALTESLQAGRSLPRTTPEWLARAEDVAALLAAHVVDQDRGGLSPEAQVALLKESGLTVMLGPVSAGGGGQTWSTALRAIRAVSAGCASVGELLGCHLLWAWSVRLAGTKAQISAIEDLYTRNNLFFGAVTDPGEGTVQVGERRGRLYFNGRKSFSSGAAASDLLVLEGLEADGTRVFAIAPTRQTGIAFTAPTGEPDPQSAPQGTAVLVDVEVGWERAARYPATAAHNTLGVPLAQQIYAEIYIGIAQGALRTALECARSEASAGGERARETGTQDYALETFGDLQSRLWAAQALTDAVDARLSTLVHGNPDALSAQERGEVAVRVCAAKQSAAAVALEIVDRVFEVSGSPATSNKTGLDIFWRNAHRHKLHDPAAHKRHEVGEYALLGRLPDPGRNL